MPWALYALSLLYLLTLGVVGWLSVNIFLPTCVTKEDYAMPVGMGLFYVSLVGYGFLPLNTQ